MFNKRCTISLTAQKRGHWLDLGAPWPLRTPTDVSCDEDSHYPARRFCSALQKCRLVHGVLRVKRFVVSTDGEVGDGRRSKGLVDAPSSR